MPRLTNPLVLFMAAGLFAGLWLLQGCTDYKSYSSSTTTPSSSSSADLLWSPAELYQQMQMDKELVVLDCRAKVPRPNGEPFLPYNDEHISGAYYIDYFCFGDPYPTTNPKKYEDALSNLGLTRTTTICLYDAGIANPQGKIFYQLERLGFSDIHILDGGFPVWKSANFPTDDVVPPARTPTQFVTTNPNNSIYAELADMKTIFDEVAKNSKQYIITDFREPPLFWGHKICPDAIRTGNMPYSALLDWHDFYNSATGKFLTRTELDTVCRNAGMNPDKVNVVICNKGWRSGIAYFVLRYIGWPRSNIIHYVGGIRAWTKATPVIDYPMNTDACFDPGKSMPGGNPDGKRFAGAFGQIGPIAYCAGGYTLISPKPASAPYTKVSDTFQAYTVATVPNDTWATLDPLPEPLAFSAGGVLNGDFYVLGGLDQNGAISKKVYRYDPQGMPGSLWQLVNTTLPGGLGNGRFSYTSTTAGNSIYIAGGLIDKATTVTSSYSAEVFAYDGNNTWTPCPPLSQGRRCHAMTAVGTTVYVLGGFYWDDVKGAGVMLKDVWALDTTNLPAGWQKKADLPMNMAGHAAAVVNGKIYIPGGTNETGAKYDMIEFDPAAASGFGASRIMMKKGMAPTSQSAAIGWPRYWYFIGVNGNMVATLGGFGGKSSNITTTPNGGKTHFHQCYAYDVTRPDP